MIVVLALCGVIWGVGHLRAVPPVARWSAMGLLLLLVMAVQAVLPGGHPLRDVLGGDPRQWLIVLFAGVLVAGYRAVLGRLRGRAQPEPAPASSRAAPDLARHARHIMLREIGGPGQRAVMEARVLVVGAGGLGAPAMMYLAAAGVGTIGVVDDDEVEVSNLSRQIIHGDADTGRPKVLSAVDTMGALAPGGGWRPYHRRFDPAMVADYDVVLDGTDNFATRQQVNAACVSAGVPLVSGALSQWEGQVSVFDPARGGPCYGCVFPKPPAPGQAPSCAEAGVLGPLPGIIGSMMAAEAVKLIAGAGEPLRGRMMIFDALYADARVVTVKRRAGCSVCQSTVSPS